MLPDEIISEFVERSKPNTDRKIETCALLCGRMENDNFIIDTLLIPN